MADKAIHEMISAFASGCIDKANFIRFREYIEKGGEIPMGELGELQNLISLVPTLLELEKPPSWTKDNLAKRLIELQEETKQKIKEEKKKSAAFEAEKTQEPVPIIATNKNEEEKSHLRGKPLHEDFTTSSVDRTGIKEQVKTKYTLIDKIVWVCLIFLFAFAFYLLSEISDSKEEAVIEVDKLRSEVVELKSELITTNEFITDHLSLIEFLNNKNIEIIKLSPTDEISGSWGRFFISFDAGEGLLQLKSVPSLPIDEIYQLWLVTKDAAFSLGVFEVSPNQKYIQISSIPYVPKEMINLYRITVEKRPGSESPRGRPILIGMIDENTTRRRR